MGAGINELTKLYKARSLKNSDAPVSIGVDVINWDSGCMIIESSKKLPFNDCHFDTVTFVACLNHIPECAQALKKFGVLKPRVGLL